MNVLITSAGRRTMLIEYFKRELTAVGGKLVVADCDSLAPALYAAEKSYIVPKIDDFDYIGEIKKICLEEKIKGVISLIDPELSLLSAHRETFSAIGVDVIVSPYEACELWMDKKATAEFCQAYNFRSAKTYDDFGSFKTALENKEIGFPVFIKPRKGSASMNINKADSLEQAALIFHSCPDLIIQEFLAGKELGIDVYVDLISKEIISVFAKEKIVMRAGETDKAKSIKSENLFALVERLVKIAGLAGPLDIDVFEVDGEYYISEINPRFGGGYPLAYESGENFPRFIINNLRGAENRRKIGAYEENIYMMKHDSVEIKKSSARTKSELTVS